MQLFLSTLDLIAVPCNHITIWLITNVTNGHISEAPVKQFERKPNSKSTSLLLIISSYEYNHHFVIVAMLAMWNIATFPNSHEICPSCIHIPLECSSLSLFSSLFSCHCMAASAIWLSIFMVHSRFVSQMFNLSFHFVVASCSACTKLMESCMESLVLYVYMYIFIYRFFHVKPTIVKTTLTKRHTVNSLDVVISATPAHCHLQLSVTMMMLIIIITMNDYSYFSRILLNRL